MEMDSDESGFEEVSMEREERRIGEELIRREGRGRQLTPLKQLPDMLFGWRPKQPRSGPIPLFFNKCELPVSLNPLTSELNPIIYLGFRPKDTYELHQLFSSTGNYPAPSYPAIQVCTLLQRYKSEGKSEREFVGMSPNTNASDLVFDSSFESGNLDMAVRVREQEYDLYMRTDANTKGHNQWYFFSVVAPKAQHVRFHILNFTKSASLYSQGMQPMVLQPDSSWKPSGYNLIYRPSKLNSLINRTYYSLSFTYSFPTPMEKVYFAYAIPYQYSQLNRLLAEIPPNGIIIKRETLCRSLGGVEVPLLVVTDCTVPVEDKASVVVTARVHPGETIGSWMMEGLIRLLVSEDELAKGLRKRLIFYIIPMLNPDGVLLGNYRTGLSGSDLNRQFQSPSSLLHPTVYSLKSLLARLKRSHRLLAFLDLHAHSQQKSVFLYGPHYPLHSVRYGKARVLPRLICAESPLYRYQACRFRNERSKRKAARLVIWKELKLTNCYTVEASFYGYIAEDRSTVPFTQLHAMEAGEAIAKGLFAYVQLEEARKHSKKPTNSPLTHSRKAKTHIKSPIEDPIPDLNEIPQASESSDEGCSADDLDPADSHLLQQEITAVITQFRRTPAQRWQSNRKLRKFDRNSELNERCESSVMYVERSRIELNSNRTVIPKVYNPAIPLRLHRPTYGEKMFRQVTCDDLKNRRQQKSPSFHLPVDITGRMNAWLCVQPSHPISKEQESDSDSESPHTKQPRCPVPPMRAFKGEARRTRPAAMLRERSELLTDSNRL